MAESAPIPIRFPPGVLERIEAAAKTMGTNRAAIVRHLVITWLDAFEKNPDVHAIDWAKLFKAEEKSPGRVPAVNASPSPHPWIDKAAQVLKRKGSKTGKPSAGV